MSNSTRHFPFKSQPLRKFFSGFFSVSDQRQGGEIDDDWEYIEVLDREISNCDHDSEMGDLDDFDHIPSPFLYLETLTEIKYTILSKADVRQRLDDKITRVCNVLLLSRAEAAILLYKFKWSVKRTQDEWLSSEEKVRKAVGLFATPVVETTEIACGICHENFPGDAMFSVSCGHQFCSSCWKGYISEAINDGPGCLTLRCSNPSCNAAVSLDMILQLSSEDDKNKFEHYFLTSYLNGKKKGKWCPAPGCDYAVVSSGCGDDSSVTCRCLNKFCWKCSNETHAPVNCATVAKWMTDINAQSETWLLANTNPCPNCKQRVHDDTFLGYFVCTHCNYEFCCVCGGDWSKHQTRKFWDDNCVCHENSRLAGFRDEDNRARENAKTYLERYHRYYEGWATSESARANAVAELKLFQDTLLEMLCGILNLSETELDFLAAAKRQMIECYQLLKWMHVYGYFLSDDEHCKRHLFEFMQEQGEELVGMLQKHVAELEDLLYGVIPLEQFAEFRWKLVMLTRVTRNYFDKMVEALKAGLSEVVSIPRPSPRPTVRPKISQAERINCSSPSPSLGPSSSPSPNPNPEMVGECGDDGSWSKLSMMGPTDSMKFVDDGSWANFLNSPASNNSKFDGDLWAQSSPIWPESKPKADGGQSSTQVGEPKSCLEVMVERFSKCNTISSSDKGKSSSSPAEGNWIRVNPKRRTKFKPSTKGLKATASVSKGPRVSMMHPPGTPKPTANESLFEDKMDDSSFDTLLKSTTMNDINPSDEPTDEYLLFDEDDELLLEDTSKKFKVSLMLTEVGKGSSPSSPLN